MHSCASITCILVCFSNSLIWTQATKSIFCPFLHKMQKAFLIWDFFLNLCISMCAFMCALRWTLCASINLCMCLIINALCVCEYHIYVCICTYACVLSPLLLFPNLITSDNQMPKKIFPNILSKLSYIRIVTEKKNGRCLVRKCFWFGGQHYATCLNSWTDTSPSLLSTKDKWKCPYSARQEQ